MIEKFKQTIQQAGSAIKEQAVSIGDAAKAKGNAIIDEWIFNIPNLEKYGLKTTYFSVGLSISPVLEIELQGNAAEFTLERIAEIQEEVKLSTPLRLVFNSIKTTAQLRQRADLVPIDPLTVRIKVRISPEINVSYGIPICE